MMRHRSQRLGLSAGEPLPCQGNLTIPSLPWTGKPRTCPSFPVIA